MNSSSDDDGDYSSSDDGDASCDFSTSTDARSSTHEVARSNSATGAGGGGAKPPSNRTSFASMIDDWMGDERSIISSATPVKIAKEKKKEKRKLVPKSSSAGSAMSSATDSSSGGLSGKPPQSVPDDRGEGVGEDGDAAEPKSRMVEGAPVYVRDPHYSWIPATIESGEDDKSRVKVRVRLPPSWEDQTVVAPSTGTRGGASSAMKLERLVRLSDYANSELPLQNLERDGVTAMGKDDMADLANLHEAAILYNLKARHADSLPYTRVGDILVAVNPFRWIEGLYSREKRDFYARSLIWHVDENGGSASSTPRGSMKAMRNDGTNAPLLATAASEKRALGYDYEKLGINPHVYETSSLAYLGLASGGHDQTILVTGESGAGKTETIKIVMNHLATVERSRPSWPESDRRTSAADVSDDDDGRLHGSGTVDRVLQANPLFESFGNAKTLRNDNSSRFGKFTQLQFDVESPSDAEASGRAVPSCHLAGSRCITYLLEKSRVVSVSEGERTFHIFYQLLGAPEDDRRRVWEGLVGASVSDFAYLSGATPESIDGLASPENWPDTVSALSTFGVEGDAFVNVMRSLCIILQLGNITFDAETVDGEERSVVSSPGELEKLSSLMGVDASEIEVALTRRFMTTRGEEFTIFLKPNEARDGCDALAKEIYARIFDFLVAKCNEATEPKGSPSEEYGTISLLDIFGFESFKVNRFEQLCINYANERLQQKYVVDNFQAIKHEYEEEGVNVFDFSLVDNTDVMELLEGKLGLITQLNEECVKRGVGGDENFVYKFKVVNSDSSRMIQDHLHRPYEFGIKHYAAPIKYDARSFIERNLDKIPADLLNCACQSTNPLIRKEFKHLASVLEAPKSGGLKKRSEATKHLVITKFKHQLTSLMGLIEKSRTRYIRCVKPNKEMKPKIMDHSHTVSQLESAGLVTAIVISRESFPNRLPYELVMERFRFLAYMFSDCHLDSGDIKVDAENLLNHLLAGVTADSHQGKVKPFACGKTRVYFRAGALEIIETTRQDHYAKSAIKLQAWFRSLRSRQRYLTLKRGMVCLQSYVRCWLARTVFARQVKSAITMQCFARKCAAEKELLRRRQNHASTVIQTRWRGIKPREKFKSIRKAAIKIQCLNRMVVGRKVFLVKKKERDEQKAMETRMSVIQQTFDDATVQGTVFSVDEGLLDEVETMFEFLRKEIVVLRKKNTKLKKELAEAESDKREIFNHASSVDHAFALSKIRNEQMSKTNMSLLDDNNRRRKEVNKLKNELKTQQQAHEAQLREMRAEFEMALRHREMEVNTMTQNLHSSAALHRREVQAVRDEAERKQEEHYSQISRLRDEIKNTQNSHQDYLSKLMDVLETTQESRKSMALPSDDMILRRRDEEIAELRDEVARLRRSTGSEGNRSNGDVNKKEAIKAMKYIVKKNRENRKSRVQQLGALTKQLEERLASGDTSQMQQLIASLKETIQIGEKSNSKMDREMVNMIDNTATYSQDSAASSDASLVAENQRLRRKLEKRHVCKKCGYKRDKKGVAGDTIAEEVEMEI